jgi:PhnB protein
MAANKTCEQRPSAEWKGTSTEEEHVKITAYLYYRDVGAALAWLENAFGFRMSGEPTTSPEGLITHAAMQIGEETVMMGCPGPDYRNPRMLGQATQALYVMVDDIDAHFAKAMQMHPAILHEPRDTPYGHRRYGVADVEGHEWYFAQARDSPGH